MFRCCVGTCLTEGLEEHKISIRWEMRSHNWENSLFPSALSCVSMTVSFFYIGPQNNSVSHFAGHTMLVRVSTFQHVRLFVTPRTVAHQAPLSMEFSRQEYWSRLPFPSPGDHPNPGIKLAFPESPALAGRFFTTAPPGKSCQALC